MTARDAIDRETGAVLAPGQSVATEAGAGATPTAAQQTDEGAGEAGQDAGGPAEHGSASGAPADREQELAASHAAFTAALDALPGAEEFRALFRQYGQRHGFRTVGRWIVGRAPRAKP